MKKYLIILLCICYVQLSGCRQTTAPAADTETSITEVTYNPEYQSLRLNTGITMSYVELGPKTGTPIILIHGATDSYLSFSQVGACLAASGFHVYIPELRGHGQSDKPEGESYTPALLADDIYAWAQQLEIPPAHYVGHSLGSFITQEIAIEHPEITTSITLIGSAASVADNPLVSYLLEGDGEFPGFNNMNGKISDDFIREWAFSENYDEIFIEKSYEHASSLPFSTWIQTFGGLTSDNTQRLEQVSCPALIIWGTEDDFFGKDDQSDLIKALGSGRITFIKKQGGSHNTHWDYHLGEEIAGDIMIFLSDI